MGASKPVHPDSEESAEQKLWKKVIARCIEEWLSGTLRYKRMAEDFLFSNSEDFQIVCASAGMDPGQLRTRLARLRKDDGGAPRRDWRER